MEISYSYRGVKTVLASDFNTPKIGVKGQVSLTTQHWTDGNKKVFTVIIQPHELLITAQRCLEQLNRIAGTNYKVFNQPK